MFGRFDITSSRYSLVGKSLFLAFTFSLAISSGCALNRGESRAIPPVIFNSMSIPDFAIGATLPNIVPADGTTSTTSFIVVIPFNDFTRTITLSTMPLPADLTCTAIDPTQIPNGAGKATLSCNSITAGAYNVTIIGTSDGTMHNTTTTFRFTGPVPDFTIVAASPVVLTLGSTATFNVTLTPQDGFGSEVNLTSTIEPTIGLTVSLSPQSFAHGSGTSTVAFKSSIPGDYTVRITGTSGSLVHTTVVAVTVTPIDSDFGISATSNLIDVKAGNAGATTITITPISGFTGTVTLALTTPALVSCSLSPSSIHSSGPSSLTCSGRLAGDYSVTINARSGVIAHSTTVDVHVAAASPVAPLPAPSTILGFPPTLFFGIVGVIVIFVVTGTLLVFRRSSRSLS